jgi:hypothetical protein
VPIVSVSKKTNWRCLITLTEQGWKASIPPNLSYFPRRASGNLTISVSYGDEVAAMFFKHATDAHRRDVSDAGSGRRDMAEVLIDCSDANYWINPLPVLAAARAAGRTTRTTTGIQVLLHANDVDKLPPGRTDTDVAGT